MIINLRVRTALDNFRQQAISRFALQVGSCRLIRIPDELDADFRPMSAK